MLIFLFFSATYVSAQNTINFDGKPLKNTEILVKDWGSFTTDHSGEIYLLSLIEQKMQTHLDTILDIKELTVVIPSTNDDMPTTIRTLSTVELRQGSVIEIERINMDSGEFGTRFLKGTSSKDCSIYIEQSSQMITSRGIFNKTIAYPKKTKKLRLIFWDGINNLEIVEKKSPKYVSPKDGFQEIRVRNINLDEPINLQERKIILSHRGIDLYDTSYLSVKYYLDKAGSYWCLVDTYDDHVKKTYTTGCEINKDLPKTLYLQDKDVLQGDISEVRLSELPMHIPRIEIVPKLYFKQKDIKKKTTHFDDGQVSTKHRNQEFAILGFVVLVIFLGSLYKLSRNGNY